MLARLGGIRVVRRESGVTGSERRKLHTVSSREVVGELDRQEAEEMEGGFRQRDPKQRRERVGLFRGEVGDVDKTCLPMHSRGADCACLRLHLFRSGRRRREVPGASPLLTVGAGKVWDVHRCILASLQQPCVLVPAERRPGSRCWTSEVE